MVTFWVLAHGFLRVLSQDLTWIGSGNSSRRYLKVTKTALFLNHKHAAALRRDSIRPEHSPALKNGVSAPLNRTDEARGDLPISLAASSQDGLMETTVLSIDHGCKTAFSRGES
jgi:hypothetical protein